MSWSDLSMTIKAELIREAVSKGIKDLGSIRKYYNEYRGGGWISKAKEFIKSNEGWVSTPYKDTVSGKNWRSVGYGFNDSGFYDRYPEGISNHYNNGITKEQAEEELDWYLDKAISTLRSTYGSKFDSLSDGQKIALLDTFYQQPGATLKKSHFYKAFMGGDPEAGHYLGVKNYDKRNAARYNYWSGGVDLSTPVNEEYSPTPPTIKTETIKYELPNEMKQMLAFFNNVNDNSNLLGLPVINGNSSIYSIPDTDIERLYAHTNPYSPSWTNNPLSNWEEIRQRIPDKRSKVREEINPNWELFTGKG